MACNGFNHRAALALTALLLLQAPEATASEPDRTNLCTFMRASKKCDISFAVAHGMRRTGLKPRFPRGASCPRIDEAWAISYASKRGGKKSFHGGIDMPAPFGTPIIAAAEGKVISVVVGLNSYRGREVVIRHTPKQTGLPYYIYTQYTHFDAPPAVSVGQHVKKGQILGLTGNSGRGRKPFVQSAKRRPAIHFAAFYSTSPKYWIRKDVVVPKNGFWMDPNALYRRSPAIDTKSLRKLPGSQKRVNVDVKYRDGSFSDADAPFIWPYLCKQK